MHHSKQPKNIIKFNSKSPKLASEHIHPNTTTTKQKKKVVVHLNNQKQNTVSKNLMEDFNSIQSQNKNINRYEEYVEDNLALQEEYQTKNESIEMQVLSQSTNNIDNRSQHKAMSDPYKIHLPQSYILAMTGLQQGVKTRQVQINKLKKKLKQQINVYQATLQQKQKFIKENKHLNTTVDDLRRQIQFLKQVINDARNQLTNEIKEKGVLQNQLKTIKKEGFSAKNDHEMQSTKYQNQIQALKNDNEKLKSQIKFKDNMIGQMKKDITLMIQQRSEEKANILTQQQVFRNEMNIIIEKLRLTEAKLKEKQALQEQKVLDHMQREIVMNRQILKDVSHQQNINVQRNRSKTMTMTADKKLSKYNDIQQNRRSQISQNNKSTFMKYQRSISRANRSTSTLKPPPIEPTKTNRRQLVGQMRQLLRYQKELVSLNYQIELLEKQMGSKCQVTKREQLQRQYGRLRRQIEKKEMEIVEIKSFLDDPLSKIK